MSKPKSRGNGQGTAYKNKNGTWTAQVIVGWKLPDDPSKPRYPVKKRKSGFATKKEAINYCSTLRLSGNDRVRMTLQQVWNAWEIAYSPRIGKSTMAGYKAAYGHFHALHGIYMDLISSDDLQDCMDKCTAGKRTHQVMKVTAGLLWGYAFDKNIIDRDITTNLFTGHGKSVKRQPLTEDEVKVIYNAIGKERYAEYIYCLCYLGFRPGEMLELRKEQLHIEDNICYFVAGKKTEAGINRAVPVPTRIKTIILERAWIPGTDYLFPMYCFSRKQEKDFTGFKQMTDSYFREMVFKPMMKKLNIADGKVPYSARHTYSDKLKKAKGSKIVKASVMGHTNYNFTETQYQSVDLDDLKSIANTLK